MGELVCLVKGLPLVSTMDMAKALKVEHASVLLMVRKYEAKFQSIRTFRFEIAKSGGRPTPFCRLDEEQATFLVTLMRNSDVVVEFKHRMTREFYRMKQELILIASQSQNAEWLETRKAGKETRLIATDSIKTFVDYAKKQGSTKAEMYYANITIMENRAMFFLEQKFANLRDVLNIHQLSTIKSADMIVMKALSDGMEKGMNYKDIYQLAKLRVESFAEIIGKTLIPESQLKIESKGGK
jgi:phage regulator Rha-like protein